jgi:hypothetical protein
MKRDMFDTSKALYIKVQLCKKNRGAQKVNREQQALSRGKGLAEWWQPQLYGISLTLQNV